MNKFAAAFTALTMAITVNSTVVWAEEESQSWGEDQTSEISEYDETDFIDDTAVGAPPVRRPKKPVKPQPGKPSAPKETYKSIGTLFPSFYWIALEKDDGEPRTEPLRDLQGNVMYMVSAKYLKELRMEGTGRILDGRCINYHERVPLPNGKREIRWRWCGPEAPYGYGYEDIPLIPFRSAAVDPRVIPLGSRLYIPAAKGAVLPDGAIHDGYFNAVDIGDMIKDKRIDIFTSNGDQSEVFRRAGLNHGKMIEIFIVQPAKQN